MAGSLLTALGLHDLITCSAREYLELGRTLATDPAHIRDVRRRLELARRSSPVFDSERYARHIEALYEQMWRRSVTGQPPAMLDLEVGANA